MVEETNDSDLTRSIRPYSLIFIGGLFLLFTLMSALGLKIEQVYIEMLRDWGQIIIGTYFIGRSAEKVMTIHGNRKKPSKINE